MSNFNEHGLLPPHGENDIVFTAEYWYLRHKLEPGTIWHHVNIDVTASFIVKALMSQIKSRFPRELVSLDRNERWSHDNHTAWLCLAKLIRPDWNMWAFPVDWKHRCHPRDLIFYGFIRYTKTQNSLSTLFWLLLPFVSLTMIISCLDTRKAGNGILRTSGKLLAWLRMEAFPEEFKLTKKICDYIIKRRFGGWYEIFKIYFGEDHINTKLAKELYE